MEIEWLFGKIVLRFYKYHSWVGSIFHEASHVPEEDIDDDIFDEEDSSTTSEEDSSYEEEGESVSCLSVYDMRP